MSFFIFSAGEINNHRIFVFRICYSFKKVKEAKVIFRRRLFQYTFCSDNPQRNNNFFIALIAFLNGNCIEIVC